MALLVGGRVDVDFDEAHVRIVQVLLRPLGADQRGVAGVAGNPCGDVLSSLGSVNHGRFFSGGGVPATARTARGVTGTSGEWRAAAAADEGADRLPLGKRALFDRERAETLGTRAGQAVRLPHDPRIDPGESSIRSSGPASPRSARCRRCCGSRPSSSPGAARPRRSTTERENDQSTYSWLSSSTRSRTRCVRAQRQARDQVHDTKLRERITQLGHDGRLDVRVGQACDFAKDEHGRMRLPRQRWIWEREAITRCLAATLRMRRSRNGSPLRGGEREQHRQRQHGRHR